MTVGKFVHKQLLIDQIRQTISAQESVFFSVLTDAERSVLLRFSVGKLVYSYCRSRDVTLAIEAISECQQLKFTHTSGPVRAAPAIMAADTFLEAISAGITEELPVPDVTDAYAVVTTAEPDEAIVTEALQTQLVEIARDYIGLVADMLVGDICKQQHPPKVAIEHIAQAMPAKAQSDAFRERALVLLASD